MIKVGFTTYIGCLGEKGQVAVINPDYLVSNIKKKKQSSDKVIYIWYFKSGQDQKSKEMFCVKEIIFGERHY